MDTRIAKVKEKLLGLLNEISTFASGGGANTELRDQVAESLQDNERVVVSGVHMINLRDLIAGQNNEEQLLERAGQIATQVVNDNLLVGERFVRKDVDTFMFVFPNQTPTGADLRSAQLADQIARQLALEDNLFAGLTFQRETKEIQRDAFFVSDTSPTSDGGTIQGGIQGSGRISDTSPSDSSTADPEWQTIERSGHFEGLWQTDSKGTRNELLSGVEFTYRPVWDVKRKVLSTYRCTPVRQHAELGQLTDYDVLGAGTAEEFIPVLDLLALKTSVETLRALHRKNRRVLMVTPINFRTLERNASYMDLRIFGRLLETAEKRDLIFELTGLPDAANNRRALDLVSALKEMGRAVTVPARLARTQFHEFAMRGLNLVHTDVAEFADNEPQAFELLDKFAEATSAANIRSIAFNLDTLSMAAAAVAAGFDYISGAAIHAPVSDPEYVLRYDSGNLLEELLK